MLSIHDLPESSELDQQAMLAIAGGSYPSFYDLAAPNVNVNIGIDQDIVQYTEIGVNVLNNSFVGVDLGHLNIGVAPKLSAYNSADIRLPGYGL
jgi:hypothetical protein